MGPLKYLPLMILLVSALALQGCNTAAGLGRDVSSVGQAVTNTAQQIKNGL